MQVTNSVQRAQQRIYEERMAQEKRIVTELVRQLRAAGYWAQSVYDGEEYIPATTTAKVLGAVFADYCGSATIHFDRGPKGRGKKSHGVFIVCGNGPDCISDWHCGDKEFARIVERVSRITNTL